MDTYFSAMASMERQQAITALKFWQAERKMLALVFAGKGNTVFFCACVERIEVYEDTVVFHGADNSTYSAVLRTTENAGYLWFGKPTVPENVASLLNQPITRDSVLAQLALAGISCVEIGTESGCLIAYELLAMVTPFPTIQ